MATDDNAAGRRLGAAPDRCLDRLGQHELLGEDAHGLLYRRAYIASCA